MQIIGIFGITILWITLTMIPMSILAQIPEGTIENSTFLTITEHRYRDGSYRDQITGTITNNSTEEISLARIYVALYDSNNQLITMESGSTAVTTIPPNDYSSFAINGIKKDLGIAHYILYPGGTP